jgi:hypothetical protein
MSRRWTSGFTRSPSGRPGIASLWDRAAPLPPDGVREACGAAGRAHGSECAQAADGGVGPVRSSTATHSMCGVCGNMSTGVTERSV